MTEKEREIVQELVDDIYNQFIDVIIKERKLPREKVVEIADGRVFSGRKAKELGLVDQLGDMASAAKLAAELTGAKADNTLIYPKKRRRSVSDYFLESAANQLTDSLQEKMESKSGLHYLYHPAR